MCEVMNSSLRSAADSCRSAHEVRHEDQLPHLCVGASVRGSFNVVGQEVFVHRFCW